MDHGYRCFYLPLNIEKYFIASWGGEVYLLKLCLVKRTVWEKITHYMSLMLCKHAMQFYI